MFIEDDAEFGLLLTTSSNLRQVGPDTFEVAGKCVRCQAIDIDPEGDATGHTGPSLLAALATAEGVGGSTSKGPTFGVLLRKPQEVEPLESLELRILEVNMEVKA